MDLEQEFSKLAKTEDLAKEHFPDINDYAFWNMYRNRILLLEGTIEEWDYHIVKDIIGFNIEDFGKPKEERKPIVLLVNSYGGLLDITFSIVDTIRTSETPVYTVNMGNALSGGCIIFLMGEKRFTTKNSWCMAHAGSGGLQGNYADTKEQSKVWDEQVENMGNMILERTGIDKRTYNKNKDKDWYLNQEQQLKYQFATDELKSINQLLEVK